MALEWADPTRETGTDCNVWSMGKSFLFSAFLFPPPLYHLWQLAIWGMNHLLHYSSSTVLKETDWGKVSIKWTKGRAVCLKTCITLYVFRAHSHIAPIPEKGKCAGFCAWVLGRDVSFPSSFLVTTPVSSMSERWRMRPSNFILPFPPASGAGCC